MVAGIEPTNSTNSIEFHLQHVETLTLLQKAFHLSPAKTKQGTTTVTPQQTLGHFQS